MRVDVLAAIIPDGTRVGYGDDEDLRLYETLTLVYSPESFVALTPTPLETGTYPLNIFPSG